MKHVALVPGKQVKNGTRIPRQFGVLREWNKGEVYSRAFICPASLRRGGQSPQNRS